MFDLVAAVEVGAVFGVLLSGYESLLYHFLQFYEDEVFLFGDVALAGDHAHSMVELAD